MWERMCNWLWLMLLRFPLQLAERKRFLHAAATSCIHLARSISLALTLSPSLPLSCSLVRLVRKSTLASCLRTGFEVIGHVPHNIAFVAHTCTRAANVWQQLKRRPLNYAGNAWQLKARGRGEGEQQICRLVAAIDYKVYQLIDPRSDCGQLTNSAKLSRCQIEHVLTHTHSLSFSLPRT